MDHKYQSIIKQRRRWTLVVSIKIALMLWLTPKRSRAQNLLARLEPGKKSYDYNLFESCRGRTIRRCQQTVRTLHWTIQPSFCRLTDVVIGFNLH